MRSKLTRNDHEKLSESLKVNPIANVNKLKIPLGSVIE